MANIPFNPIVYVNINGVSIVLDSIKGVPCDDIYDMNRQEYYMKPEPVVDFEGHLIGGTPVRRTLPLSQLTIEEVQYA